MKYLLTRYCKILFMLLAAFTLSAAFAFNAQAQCDGPPAGNCTAPNCTGSGCDRSYSAPGEVCQILSPYSYDEVASQCDPAAQSPGYTDCSTDPGDPPVLLSGDLTEICNTFTAKCDVIERFQMASCATTAYVTGPVTNHVYDSGGTLVCCFDGFGGTDIGSLTPGETYTHCMTFIGYTGDPDYAAYQLIPWTQVPADPVADFQGAEAEATVVTAPACGGTQYCFTNTGSSGCTYSWDFDGDGVEDSNQENACYTFPVPNGSATYNVTLTTCCDGCCESTTLTATVDEPPTAAWAVPAAACAPVCMAFDGSASDCPNGGCTYDWDFGDGGTASGTSVNYCYSTGGTYSVSLTVTDANNNCLDVLTQDVTVYPRPTIAGSVTDASCLGGFDGAVDITVTGGQAPYTYSWSNGATTEDISGLSAGTYTVTVTDDLGCQRTGSYTVADGLNACTCPYDYTVSATLDAGSNNCAGDNSYTFTYAGDDPVDYFWNFGDGTTTSGSASVSHTFATSGTFTVTLCNLVDCSECVRNTTVTIANDPVANAGLDREVCLSETTTLTASGAGTGGSYSWAGPNIDSDPNLQSIDVTATGAPGASETYTVTATNSSGCTATDDVIVNINALQAEAGASPQTVCRNTDLPLTGTWTNATVDPIPGTTTTYNGAGCAFPDNDPAGCTAATTTATATGADNWFLQEVCVDITYDYFDELRIYVSDPCGNEILLADLNGNNDAINGTICFSDGAATTIGNATSPYAGPYVPATSLTALEGACGTAGNWNVRVSDNNSMVSAAVEGNAYCTATYGASFSYSTGGGSCGGCCCRDGGTRNMYDADGDGTQGPCAVASGDGGTVNSFSVDIADTIPGTPALSWSTALGLSSTTTAATTFNTGSQGAYTKYFTITDDNCSHTDSVDIYVCKCAMLIDSTAGIHIVTGIQGATQFQFDLTEEVVCSTLDPTQWSIACINCPSGNSYSITNVTCVGGAANPVTGDVVSDVIEFTIDPPYDARDTLAIDPNAGNTMINVCGDIMQSGAQAGSGIVLDVEMAWFRGKQVEEGVELSWVTATEVANKHFIVQRSTDGDTYKDIGIVTGAGTSYAYSRYEFIDKSPVVGVNYYRLMPVSESGVSTYSNVIAIRYTTTGALGLVSIKPVPAKDQVAISYNTLDHMKEVSIEVYSSTGQLIHSDKLKPQRGNNQHSLDISEWNQGIYLIRLITPDHEYAVQGKIIKY